MASIATREQGKKRGFRTTTLLGLKDDTPTGESVAWNCELTGRPERREVWQEAKRVEYLEVDRDYDGKPIPAAYSPQGHPLPGRIARKMVYATSLDDKNLPDPKTIDGFVKFDLRRGPDNIEAVYVVREFIITDHCNGSTSKLYTFRTSQEEIARKAEKEASERALAEIGRNPNLLKKLLTKLTDDDDVEDAA